LKARYTETPGAARITPRAVGNSGDSAMSCSVDLGRAIHAAQQP